MCYRHSAIVTIGKKYINHIVCKFHQLQADINTVHCKDTTVSVIGCVQQRNHELVFSSSDILCALWVNTCLTPYSTFNMLHISVCVESTLLFSDVCCISLTSSPDEVKPPGETVKLSCQISGYALTDYGTAWIRQPPGKSMEWIGIIWGGGGINNGASFKTRFSISRDTSSNVLYLDISSLKPEDTAVYYCAKTATAIQLSGRGVQKPRKSKNFNTKCNDDQTDKYTL